jgi:ribonuclease inhibitor
MKTVIIDGNKIADRKILHEYLQTQLDFPSYYGKNLDALYDLLSCYTKEVEIQFIHRNELEFHLEGYAKTLYNMLLEISTINPMVTVGGEMD